MDGRRYVPVCKGSGLYHAPKVNYSKETQSFVKELINESKLSIIQKNSISNSVKNGDPLPKMVNNKQQTRIRSVIIKSKPKISKKRTIDTIVTSGAYERESFTPIYNKDPYEKEKSRLQSLMAFGKDVPPSNLERTVSVKNRNKDVTKDDIFNHLIKEVEDRAQFLDEMNELSEGKNYTQSIENEIAVKIKQMEMLDKTKCEEQVGVVAKYRNKFNSKCNNETLGSVPVYFNVGF